MESSEPFYPARSINGFCIDTRIFVVKQENMKREMPKAKLEKPAFLTSHLTGTTAASPFLNSICLSL
jgi:hypothetical protein